MVKNQENKSKESENSEFAKLISDSKYLQFPKIGEVIKGTVISASKSEVKLDIGGVKIGIVRGRELYNESEEYSNLKPDDTVEATVIELENENGEMELSFRYAGQQKAWENLRNLMKSEEIVPAKITDANKGGLMVKIGHVSGFLPVSQLIPEHYPRVEGGDKNKILEFLRKFINQNLQVKIIDADEKEDKLIVSEKAAWEEAQEKAVSQYKVGDKIKGKITAVTDFGAFVEFGEKMEGLVHISELAWQRIDNPRDFVKVGDKVEAEIINIENTKVFLSMKKLQKDPWAEVTEKYKIGDKVKGKVIKANPFGLFVELDEDIHGLAHISELSDKSITDLNEIAQPGEVLDFKIISIEPDNHRLGLSLKAVKDKSKKTESTKTAEKKDKKTQKDEKKKSEKKEKPDDKKEEKKDKKETKKTATKKESADKKQTKEKK
ncbi:MAG: S1 RNA-binding domain-containing protein [Candidatus Buchananbacteria bacterium]|nr:S1 RNA-binding domain-containing protein [Candidatus Buchananbacteria bacterium]